MMPLKKSLLENEGQESLLGSYDKFAKELEEQMRIACRQRLTPSSLLASSSFKPLLRFQLHSSDFIVRLFKVVSSVKRGFCILFLPQTRPTAFPSLSFIDYSHIYHIILSSHIVCRSLHLIFSVLFQNKT
jgi:hypothetical protein